MRNILISSRDWNLYFFFLIILIVSPIHSQDSSSLPTAKARISNQRAVYSVFYAKKNIKVCPDTLTEDLIEDTKYVAVNPIFIPKGKTINCNSGVTFYFEPKASLKVEGKLIGKGTNTNPLSFRVIPKGEWYYNSDTTDTIWEGILAGSESKVLLTNAKISEADIGLNSTSLCNSVVLDNVKFEKIKGQVLVVNSVAIKVAQDSAISYNCTLPKKEVLPPLSNIDRQKIQTRNIIAYSLYAACLLSGGLAAFEFNEGWKTDNEAAKIAGHVDAQTKRDKATKMYKNGTILSACALGLLATGVSVHLTFPIRGMK